MSGGRDGRLFLVYLLPLDSGMSLSYLGANKPLSTSICLRLESFS